MSSRSEKEKAKRQNDRHQSILAEMLHENENKFCSDCNAKGPRWASWNLGVFLCIRCAGIHRNLGVHISRVKSVNLDSWTPEQIENIQQWGNKRSREVYEYYLPEDFRRPQGDSAMEAFIRNKYEKKIYLRKDGVPPHNKPVNTNKETENKEKQVKRERKKDKETTKVERPKPSNNTPASSAAPSKSSSSASSSQPSSAPAPTAPQSNIVDLLSLDTPTPTQEPGLVDLFGPAPAQSAPPPTLQAQAPQVDLFAPQPTPVPQTQSSSQPSQSSQPASNPEDIESALFEGGEIKAKSAKDSIMALYQSQTSQNQMFGVPGNMYMPSSQPKPQAQPTPQQGPGYQMFNGSMMGYPQQQPQMNMAVGFPQQQQQQQQQFMPQHVQVGQIQQQMQQLRLKHSMSQPSLVNNHPANMTNNQMQFLAQPPQMTNWMSQPQLSGFQPPTQPQFITTGPVNNTQGYNMFPMGTTPPVGNTLSHQLWK